MNGLIMAIKSNEMERRQGFTLLELLVVIAVIGMLVAILMAAVGGIKDKAILRRAETEVRNLALAVRAYHTEMGDWPVPSAQADTGGVWSTNNIQVFKMLVKPISQGGNGRRNYLELTDTSTVLKDPFKTKMCYMVTIDVTNNSVEVKSAGKDGVFGSGDDVSITY